MKHFSVSWFGKGLLGWGGDNVFWLIWKQWSSNAEVSRAIQYLWSSALQFSLSRLIRFLKNNTKIRRSEKALHPSVSMWKITLHFSPGTSLLLSLPFETAWVVTMTVDNSYLTSKPFLLPRQIVTAQLSSSPGWGKSLDLDGEKGIAIY